MKVGDIITIDRLVSSGTGYYYYPVLLTGGVALLGIKNEMVHPETPLHGGPEIQHFTFQFLQPGTARVQLARFRTFDISDALYENVCTYEVEGMPTEAIEGGWTPFADPTEEELALFNVVLSGLMGADYEPVKVSRQIVGGTNYRFFCYGTLVTPQKTTFPAIVRIFKPIEGQPELRDIQRIAL